MMRLTRYTLAILFLILTVTSVSADWKEEANRRIEDHRKEDVTIRVSVAGKPISGATVSLKMMEHEFLFGCNIFKWGRCQSSEENEIYNRRFSELFNFATLGFYWWAYEPRMDEPGYAYSEQVAAWCKANAIQTKGHPLAWNFVDPDWARELDDAELYRRQMERIKACTSRFSGQMDTWDVINEVVGWDREECRQNAPRMSALMKERDPVAFAKTCFEMARQGNPAAKLLINDYVTDQSYVKLIEKLVDSDGKPLYDIIGIQSHMHGGTWSNEQLWDTCERFVKFNVPLHFTELTVLSGSEAFHWDTREPLSSTPEGEEKQKTEVERIYTMLFSHPSVEAITWWDLSDQGAWMQVPAGLIRSDLTPKPAYHTLEKLVRETWATNETLKTDSEGQAAIRAFRGTYQVEITLPDGRKETFPAAIVKSKND
ncbi:MAG: endo-1,4-beta-xylanase, partial [Planctomycetaceae bacterium]|nr:endo-1,4-beta-xylanase [Planctomycetaceae bacterium]